MNAGYVSAFAALAGSLIGGLTTFAAAWAGGNSWIRLNWVLEEARCEMICENRPQHGIDEHQHEDHIEQTAKPLHSEGPPMSPGTRLGAATDDCAVKSE
jgi:hypothetical protein